MKRKYVRGLIPLAVFALIVFIAIRLFISFVVMPLQNVHDRGSPGPYGHVCPNMIRVDGKNYLFFFERLGYDERPDCEIDGTIETIIPIGMTPAHDNEANFYEAKGASYVICDGYLAILLRDTWYRSNLSESEAYK